MKNTIKTVAVVAAISVGPTANATIATVFDGITAGVSSFDSTVTGTGATVGVDIWTGLTSGSIIDRGDYTITQNDGGSGTILNTYPPSLGTLTSLSGQVISIAPGGGGTNPRTDPLDYFSSGISFNFTTPVNAVGFEVGDWATCCFEPTTDLFISFDGGIPILVASANESSDGFYPSQTNPTVNVYEIFVAAFDDTGEFNTVAFWGNGNGEALFAGGQLRYALVDQGSLDNPVPEPAALILLAVGLAGASLSRKKQLTTIKA